MLDRDGIWVAIDGAPGKNPRAALFLDRDGVIVEEVNYLHRLEDVAVLPGIAAVIRRANALDIPVVVVTNQSGVGRGCFDWSGFGAITEEIARRLDQEGATVDAWLACPFHRDARPPYDIANHADRKPNPGMLLKAAGRLNLALADSWIIGDKASDLAAGRAAGLAGGLLVLTGHGPQHSEAALALADDSFSVTVVEGADAALALIPFLGRDA